MDSVDAWREREREKLLGGRKEEGSDEGGRKEREKE